MEFAISMAFGAAVACVAFLIGTCFVRSDRSVETSHDRLEKETEPSSAPPIVERPTEAATSQVEPASPEPRRPSQTEWKPIETVRPRTLPAPVIATGIPKCIAFLDVETTGLNEKDRVVTLAGVKLLDTDLLATGTASLAYLHLIFDPGKKSHPRAEAVHGYSDWVLRHQDGFGAYAETIESFFNSADLVVAHNAEFDLGFYNREMDRAARRPIAIPGLCTMSTYRQRGFGGSCSLDAVCQKIGAARNGKLHGALEDAWLAMRVYLWLNQRNFAGMLPIEFASGPSNFKDAPPLPLGPLPRRRRKATSVAASHSLN
ncbi:exonuclease domain-containing protein [Bradyrhizobium sp. URHD0069]|uniref:3'-5' exonuclease n=1 Tax=Bradyrhizobium sp. URHD0069 TaxID=1380355 RepID=UPI0012DCB2CD|nr:exonuclease domain-containing protein [Bradyrhizobium sp. URHD0069]